MDIGQSRSTFQNNTPQISIYVAFKFDAGLFVAVLFALPNKVKSKEKRKK